jgi:hypothetical protein
VHFEAHGLMDDASGRPMAKDALFIMMSSTKPVLAVAALMMIEEGLIRPSDPVSKFIPEFADMQVAVLKNSSDEEISPYRVSRDAIPEHRAVPAETPITIQHILTHTSGILSGGLGSAVAQRVPREIHVLVVAVLGCREEQQSCERRYREIRACLTGIELREYHLEDFPLPGREFVRTRLRPLHALAFCALDDAEQRLERARDEPAGACIALVLGRSRSLAELFRSSQFIAACVGLDGVRQPVVH